MLFCDVAGCGDLASRSSETVEAKENGDEI
jgi:hypothetical protein